MLDHTLQGQRSVAIRSDGGSDSRQVGTPCGHTVHPVFMVWLRQTLGNNGKFSKETEFAPWYQNMSPRKVGKIFTFRWKDTVVL